MQAICHAHKAERGQGIGDVRPVFRRADTGALPEFRHGVARAALTRGAYAAITGAGAPAGRGMALAPASARTPSREDDAVKAMHLLALTGGWLPLAVLAAPALQSVDSLREAALSTVPDRAASGVQVEAAIDPALRLPACATALTAQAGAGGVAEVGCPAAGWRLYIPVRVRRLAPVLVLARPLAAGEVLTAEVLRIEQRDVARLPQGSVADPARVAGRVARRALPAGAVLAPQDVAAPRLVRRGDSVTLVARLGGVEVRMLGRALQDAGLDERLTVENSASRRVVQGILQDRGEVAVE